MRGFKLNTGNIDSLCELPSWSSRDSEVCALGVTFIIDPFDQLGYFIICETKIGLSTVFFVAQSEDE